MSLYLRQSLVSFAFWVWRLISRNKLGDDRHLVSLFSPPVLMMLELHEEELKVFKLEQDIL